MFLPDIAHLVDKEQPQEEHHTIKQVLEDIGMEQFKPLRMELGEQRDGKDTEQIEYIDAYPTEGNIPDFVFPATANSEQKTEPDKRLLERGATPDDVGADTRVEIVGGGACQGAGVAKKTYEPIDLACDMVCEKIKGRGDVQSEPHNQRVALIAVDGELPEIIRHKQGNDKNNDVGVRRKDRLDFFAREHGQSARGQICVLAYGTSSRGQKSRSRNLK